MGGWGLACGIPPFFQYYIIGSVNLIHIKLLYSQEYTQNMGSKFSICTCVRGSDCTSINLTIVSRKGPMGRTLTLCSDRGVGGYLQHRCILPWKCTHVYSITTYNRILHQGGRTSSKKHVKNYIPVCGKFTGIYRDLKVSACSIKFCRGSMGFNARNTFVLRVEHPYIVRKSEKSLDMGELTFHAEETACCWLQQEAKVHV